MSAPSVKLVEPPDEGRTAAAAAKNALRPDPAARPTGEKNTG